MRKQKWVLFERLLIAPLRLLTALLFAFSTLSVPVSVTHAQDDLETALAEVQAATTITGTLDTDPLSGVDWSRMRAVVLADYRPGGSSGPYDMLQAARVPLSP